MSVETDRPPDDGAATCPCGRGDVAAAAARQRPLLERAARGDREAFARLYLAQVDGVYRYLLAWTGDQAAARELTEQVFRAALLWLPVIAGGEAGAPRAGAAGASHADVGDVGAWLVAMARDAVAQRREAEEQADRRPSPADPLEAVALLGDPEREVVVLRLLLGHSLAHTAHLSGFSRRTVTELQLAACLALRGLVAGPDGGRADGPAPPADPATTVSPAASSRRAAELERRLGRHDVDLTGDDPELADALTVASTLRRVAPSQVAGPDRSFVLRLKAALAGAGPAAAGGALHSARRAVAAFRTEVVGRPRPWVATAVAATAILVILTVQAFGSSRPPACGGRPCPPATTPAAAPASATAAPLTSIRRKTTSTRPPPTTALAAPVPTPPPTTAPATTAPRTTRPPRTTTSRRPTTTTTTAATTTSATTTTSAPTTTT
jgi:DNA-directed RNA polymerase specialized sigma24 family protein